MGNLSSFYRRKYVWVVFFYNREKNDIKKLSEEFKTLASHMKGIIEVGAVDWQENDEIWEELGVTSKNHVIKIYTEKISDTGEIYKGKTEWKLISNYATSKMESFVSIVTNENYNDFMQREKNSIKLLLFSNKKNIPALYKALSKFSKLISFGMVKEGDALQSSFNIKTHPSLWVVTSLFDFTTDCFTGEMKLENLKDFLRDYLNGKKKVNQNTQVKLIELTKEKMKRGLWDEKDQNFCLIYFSSGTADDKRAIHNIEKTLENFSKNPITFAYVDINENQEFYRNFGTKNKLIIYRPKRLRYVEYTHETIDSEKVEIFVEGIIDGNGKYIKMDSLPTFEYMKEDL